MKHALIGPRGEIMIVLDHPVTSRPPACTTAELTDEQATEVATLRTGKQLPMLLNGAVTTIKDILDARMMWTDAGWVVRPVPPAPPVPTLTRKQIRLLLLSLNVTATDVDAVIAKIPEATARETARIEWEDSTEYHHDHPLTLSIGAALGLKPAEIDAAFRKAALL